MNQSEQIKTLWYKKLSTPNYILIFIGLVIAQILILYSMGRLFVCECGYIKFWEGDVMSTSNSQQIADWYTFSHIIHGFIFYGFFIWISKKFFNKNGDLPLGLIFISAVILEASWEVIENSTWIIEYYRNNTVSLGYIGDSILNSVFDVVWMAIGFVMARKMPVWSIILIAVVFELMTGYFVRDGLLLNILMFIYPSEAVKAWQVAV